MLFGFCPFESNSIAKLISVLEENDLVLPLEINPISPQTQNILKRVLTKDHFRRIDWPSLFQLLGSDVSSVASVASEESSASTPTLHDDRLRVSLGNLPEWEIQKDRKNGLGSSGKINSATNLETAKYDKDFHKPGYDSPSKPGYYPSNPEVNGQSLEGGQFKRTTTVFTKG